MAVQKLTDDFVSALTCPPSRAHIEYYDTLLRGLYVDVQANGRMAYRVRYRQDGRKRSHTLGDARLLTVAEARDQARTALRKVLAGGDPKAIDFVDGPTIHRFFTDQYLPYVKSYKRSWSTDETMIRNHLVPALGDRAMGSVLAPDIARLIDAMRARGYAPGTVNRCLVLLRYGYTLALRWRISGIEYNPAKEIKSLKVDNKIERFLSQEETTRLLAALRKSHNPMLEPIVTFLLLTGARKREALDAKWAEINWRQRLWRIPKTKSGKVRHVPLSSDALRMLTLLRESVCLGTEHIFTNPRTGKAFVSIFYSWDSARRQADLPDLRIHDLRHSFASFLVNGGRRLYEVQELLGHADIRTTSRYAHLSRERLREAVETVRIG